MPYLMNISRFNDPVYQHHSLMKEYYDKMAKAGREEEDRLNTEVTAIEDKFYYTVAQSIEGIKLQAESMYHLITGFYPEEDMLKRIDILREGIDAFINQGIEYNDMIETEVADDAIEKNRKSQKEWVSFRERFEAKEASAG